MNYILYCDSQGVFSIAVLWKQLLRTLDWGDTQTPVWLLCTCLLSSLDWNWDTKHIQIFPNVAVMWCVCTFACRKFDKWPEDLSQRLAAADLDSERENQKREEQRQPDIYYWCGLLKYMTAQKGELKNREKLCEKIVGQPCWPAATWLWELLQTTLPLSALTDIY